jgi:hypothetical protein
VHYFIGEGFEKNKELFVANQDEDGDQEKM